MIRVVPYPRYPSRNNVVTLVVFSNANSAENLAFNGVRRLSIKAAFESTKVERTRIKLNPASERMLHAEIWSRTIPVLLPSRSGGFSSFL